jgi:hypothetical protein
MPDWFVHSNGQQQGPLSAQQMSQMIRAGAIAESDLAWREGMPQWDVVGAIPELAGAATTATATTATATAGDIAALPPLGPVSIADDPGPFRTIGSQFSINGKAWAGRSVFSPDAVYLLKTRKVSQAGLHGGVAGALLAAAFTSEDDTRTCDITDLPPAVRAQLDPKAKRKSGDVVIVRKGAVSYVKVPRVNNVVTFTVAGERMKVNTGAFAVGRAGRFLAENGWALNQELQPTEAPIHGQGFGRDPATPKKRPGALKRVLYVIIAIALVALVIGIRILAGH